MNNFSSFIDCIFFLPILGGKNINKISISNISALRCDFSFQAANSNHFWPKGRGIYHNSAKTFLVWVNEEDHLRVISMQQGGNVFEVNNRKSIAKDLYRNPVISEKFKTLNFFENHFKVKKI